MQPLHRLLGHRRGILGMLPRDLEMRERKIRSHPWELSYDVLSDGGVDGDGDGASKTKEIVRVSERLSLMR